MIWEDLAPQLTEPFNPKDVQWRAGSVSRDKKRAQALAYAEPRVYEDRLNEVLGADWEVTFEPWGDQRLTCTLTIWLENETGERVAVRRSSTGEFDSSDRIAQGTAAEAQALKRACVKFGLGRYLYDLPASWAGYDENSRRLTETPALPRDAVPTAASVKPTKRETPATDQEPKLSASRANAMGQKLLEFGLEKQAQLQLASTVVGRPVKALTELTESEALAVFEKLEAVQKRAPKLPRDKKPASQVRHQAGFDDATPGD